MEAGSVTLVFYKLPDEWHREPILNLIAAFAQQSSFTHVELAIGSCAGTNGEMTNVARVFNGSTGVELMSRTGRNPSYSYVQLGCTLLQEQAMLRHARGCVGKPFSNYAMARSIVYPRTTNGQSYFCAELVADILRAGGMMSSDSNPGSATPEYLHSMYSTKAALSANPFLLRDRQFRRQLTAASVSGVGAQHQTVQTRAMERMCLAQEAIQGAVGAKDVGVLHVVAARQPVLHTSGLTLNLASLDMSKSLSARRN